MKCLLEIFGFCSVVSFLLHLQEKWNTYRKQTYWIKFYSHQVIICTTTCFRSSGEQRMMVSLTSSYTDFRYQRCLVRRTRFAFYGVLRSITHIYVIVKFSWFFYFKTVKLTMNKTDRQSLEVGSRELMVHVVWNFAKYMKIMSNHCTEFSGILMSYKATALVWIQMYIETCNTSTYHDEPETSKMSKTKRIRANITLMHDILTISWKWREKKIKYNPGSLTKWLKNKSAWPSSSITYQQEADARIST